MWLIVGGNSEIGAFTAREMGTRGDEVVVTSRRLDEGSLPLDLGAPLDEWWPPPAVSSACVCAAISRIAQCDADPLGTARINVTQTAALVERLLGRGAHVLYLSSNQVFDGTRASVPSEAERCPVSEYGRQKAQMEALLGEAMADGAPVAVLRLAKVVLPDAPLLTSWVRALRAGSPVTAFAEMSLAPVPVGLVSEAIRCLMRDRRAGIYQLSGPCDVSYLELAMLIAERLGASRSLVREGSAGAAGLPVGACPRFTTLDSSELRSLYGIRAPDMSTLVRNYIEKLPIDPVR